MQTWTTTTRLLERLNDFEDEVWGDLLERFRGPVIHLARRVGLDDHHAQDVAQNTMLAFARRYREGGYDRDKGRLRSWLFGIAWREAQQARRQLARDPIQPAASEGRTTFFSAQPDERECRDSWEVEWERTVLRKCLDQVRREVSPQTYDAFDRVAFRKESPADVAASLDMTRNAVFIAKHRVLKRLSELQCEFEDLEIDEPDS